MHSKTSIFLKENGKLKYHVNVFIEMSITFSRKIYIKLLHYSKYGRKERDKNERL